METATLSPVETDSTEALTVQRFSPAPAQKGIVPGDVVNHATSKLPEDQRSTLRWLHNFQCENNLTTDELATQIKRAGRKTYDGNTLYKIFRGVHEASLTKVCRAINEFKTFVEDRSTIKRFRFIPTSVSEEIFEFCQVAFRQSKVGFIFGDGQIGKSISLEEYTRAHNHGETRYVRMPAGGGKRDFLEEIAIALRISPQQSTQEIRRRVVRAFDNRMLLVIDEAHQLFAQKPRVETAELIREIHDRCKCGLILCGTRLFKAEIRSGRYSTLLKQLDRRKFGDLVLEDILPTSDLNSISAEYGLPKAAGDFLKIQSEVNRRDGVGRWFTLLTLASDLAGKRKAKLTWDHVRDCYEDLIDRDEQKLLAAEKKNQS